MKKYESPKAELLELEDVITASSIEVIGCLMCASTSQEEALEAKVCAANNSTDPTATKAAF